VTGNGVEGRPKKQPQGRKVTERLQKKLKRNVSFGKKAIAGPVEDNLDETISEEALCKRGKRRRKEKDTHICGKAGT